MRAAARAEEVALRYMTEVHASGSLTIASNFEVPRWSPAGPPGADPGGEVVSWEFVPPDEAGGRLTTLGWPAMEDPVVEHLAGVGSAYYVCREDGGGSTGMNLAARSVGERETDDRCRTLHP